MLQIPLFYLIIGILGLFAVIVWDINMGLGVFKETWPILSIKYIMRSLVICFSITAFLFFFYLKNETKEYFFDYKGLPHAKRILSIVLTGSLICLFLFLFIPAVFSYLAFEDHPVEWASALFFFIDFILLLKLFIKIKKNPSISFFIKNMVLFFAILFFIVAMEEVSWFQRVFHIKTPAIFKGNEQHELNIHNFATNYLENTYYFGVWVLLIFSPFVVNYFPRVAKKKDLKIFIANPVVMVLATVAYAYNFDMWNIIFTQITFFGTILILTFYSIYSKKEEERYVLIFTILIIILSQVLFLIKGENFARTWEITEYKEFFLALALSIYVLDILFSIKKLKSANISPLFKL